MKCFREVIIPERKENQLEKTICDNCNKELISIVDNYTEEVTIQSKQTVSDRDGGGETSCKEYHLCPTCFESVLVAFFDRIQIRPTTETISF